MAYGADCRLIPTKGMDTERGARGMVGWPRRRRLRSSTKDYEMVLLKTRVWPGWHETPVFARLRIMCITLVWPEFISPGARNLECCETRSR